MSSSVSDNFEAITYPNLADGSQRSKRFMPQLCDVDALSPELLGAIFSRLDVSDLLTASIVNKKWRHAVREWVFKISCTYPSAYQRKYEHTITATVWKTNRVRHFSVIGGIVLSRSLNSWLRWMKQSLRSFVFQSRTFRRANVLKRLVVMRCDVENFIWQNGVIPRDDLTKCSLPSLVSLTLDKVTVSNGAIKDLELLLSTLPNLRYILLLNMAFTMEATNVLTLNPSVTTLIVKRVNLTKLSIHMRLILNASNLSKLHVIGLLPRGRTLVLQLANIKTLQEFLVQDIEFVLLSFGRNFKYFDSHRTRAIIDFGLKFFPLKRLLLLVGVLRVAEYNSDILRTIASRFPNLQWLSIPYQKSFDTYSNEHASFAHLTELEMYAYCSIDRCTNRSVPYARGLMEICPKLEHAAVRVKTFSTGDRIEEFNTVIAVRDRQVNFSVANDPHEI